MTVIRCVACGVTFISGLAYLDRTHRCVLHQSQVSHPSNPRPAS
jgi:hypothetical protein